MPQLLWELKIIVCDICRERPIIDTIKINGEYMGVCKECMAEKEDKND